MDDRYSKGEAKQLLEELGFAVTEIPERENELTPDFHAKKNGNDFIIELKTRLDDEKRLDAEQKTLEQGSVTSRSGTINRTNTVSGIVAEAAKQLNNFSAIAGAFKIVWLHASGSDPALQFMQFRGSLYGLCDIIDMDDRNGNLKDCYYFGFSDFFRYRSILDGAILTKESKLQLCINDLSPNANAFRDSSIVETFRQGVTDPPDLERRGLAYIADCPHDRREKQKVISYLQSKYNKNRLMDINLTKYSAMTRV